MFFTRGAGALNDVRGVLDEAAEHEFCRAVTSQCADGAAYAQLACRDLEALFPRLRAIVRDRAHAVVNAMKHAAQADDLVTNLVQTWKEKFVSGRVCVAKEITHCEGFRQTFELACQTPRSAAKPGAQTPLMLSLCYGKARFASQVAPERRLLLQVLGLAVALRRRASQGKKPEARCKLKHLNFRALATMAAITDGEEATLEFVRQVEAERSDPSGFAALVDEFLARLRAVFEEAVSSGPTRSALGRRPFLGR